MSERTVTKELKKLVVEAPRVLSSDEKQALGEAWTLVVTRHPWSSRLPAKVGAIVDPAWEGSAGHWVSSLRLQSDREISAVRLAARTVNGDPGLARTLVHELTHLIQWSARPGDPGWLREGFALLSEHAVTGELNAAFFAGWKRPTAGLFSRLALTHADLKDSWERMDRALPQYGQLLELFLYMDRVCFGGKPGALLETAGARFGEPAQGRGWLWSLVPPAARECREFDRFFALFQVARFTQGVGALEYTYPVAGMAETVERPPSPAALEPYSAAAYFSDSACLPGEIELEADLASSRRRCLRIRFAR